MQTAQAFGQPAVRDTVAAAGDPGLIEQALKFIKPETIINYGIPLLALVVFAETGLFFGFFFPGDSLLFSAGVFAASPVSDLNVSLIVGALILAAIAGNQVGYWFGGVLGNGLQNRKDSFFFKRKHLETAESYYAKNGSMALIMGRFLPIIRTFAPIVAGMVKMDKGKFFLYNVVGAVAWVGSMTLSGYFLGKVFPDIYKYLHWVILGIVGLTLLPVLSAYVKSRRSRPAALLAAAQAKADEEAANDAL